jgi:predicted nucleic acid-binding protein
VKTNQREREEERRREPDTIDGEMLWILWRHIRRTERRRRVWNFIFALDHGRMIRKIPLERVFTLVTDAAAAPPTAFWI